MLVGVWVAVGVIVTVGVNEGVGVMLVVGDTEAVAVGVEVGNTTPSPMFHGIDQGISQSVTVWATIAAL